MAPPDSARLQAAFDALPDAYPGPGGAAAVVWRGEVLEARAWGYRDAELGLPVTRESLFRICSITKQFTSALALELHPDLSQLDADVGAALPHLEGPRPRTVDLLHNQSGLRDYWALTMMQGARAEDLFGDAAARRLMGAPRSLQFEPGTRYSYANQNFRLISNILEARAGRDFGELLTARVLRPCGMERALPAPDTRALPDGGVGYEGSPATGHAPARTAIYWTGDAGLAASLEDMIAWERFIDRTRDDPEGLYARLSAPVAFADGAPAAYGFGLARHAERGRPVTAHGGALRGWRSHRMHAASERLSVVVLFNHLSDAGHAAAGLFAAALGETGPRPAAEAPAPAWLGEYVEPETGLLARVEEAGPGAVRLHFGHWPDLLVLEGPDRARSESAELERRDGALWMRRPRENLSGRLEPTAPRTAPFPEGRYACAEIGSELHLARSGGRLYGAFQGPLGSGRYEPVREVAAGAALMACNRALDHTPPGDFTLRERDAGRRLEVGCWLARGLSYERRS